MVFLAAVLVLITKTKQLRQRPSSSFHCPQERMASHLRRTDDLERLKTRSIVLQNSDGTYPAPSGAMYIGTGGTVAVSDNATVDGSGNLVCKTATIGDVSDTATSLTVNGNAVVHGNATVTGMQPSRASVQAAARLARITSILSHTTRRTIPRYSTHCTTH